MQLKSDENVARRSVKRSLQLPGQNVDSEMYSGVVEVEMAGTYTEERSPHPIGRGTATTHLG